MKLEQLTEATRQHSSDKLTKYVKTGYLKPNASKEYKIKNKTIETLEGLFPIKIDGDLILQQLDITSLKGCPEMVNGRFQCTLAEITSLKGGPEWVNGDYWVGNCDQLESLEGAPKYINGAAMILWNPKLEDLHNVHKHFGEIRGDIRFGNSVRRNALGLLLIKGLTRVSGFGASAIENIFNKYLPNNRGMEAVFECQEELIAFNSQGSEGYAHL